MLLNHLFSENSISSWFRLYIWLIFKSRQEEVNLHEKILFHFPFVSKEVFFKYCSQDSFPLNTFWPKLTVLKSFLK